ncbi:MAG: AraC family transcriptional regulator [Paenibacillus sp.]|nr:AraC family transcriptional regulator [Paenibacillus sp.]
MGKFKLNSRLFYQYIASYIVVLILPVLVIGFVAYNYIIQLMREEVIRSNLTVLSQVKDTIDLKMNELQSIAVHIATNPHLSPYTATKNAFNEMNAISELRNYASANYFIHDMLLYFRGGSKLYSPYSVFAAQSYTDKIFRYENWSADSFYRDINMLEAPLLRPAENVSVPNPEKFITFIVPIPYRETSPYGTVVFQIKAKTVNDMIVTTFGDYGGNAIILNERDELITSLAPVSSPALGDLADTVRRRDGGGSGTIRLEGSDYFAGYTKSDASGWTYVSLVDQSTVMKTVQLVKARTLYSLLLVLLLGSIAIYYVMSFNYAPIRRLKQFVDTRIDRAFRNTNELESIRSAFRYISDHNDELHRKLDSSKPALRTFLLSALLKGEFHEIRQFNARAEAADLRFAMPLFRVLLFAFSRKDDIRRAPGGSIIQEVETLLSDRDDNMESQVGLPAGGELEGFGLDSLDGNKLIFIVGTRANDDASLNEKLASVQRHLMQKRGLHATIGIGNPYADAGEIGKSYIEATGAVDYRLIKGHGKVIFFGEIVSRTPVGSNDYSINDWSRLKLYIVQGDTGQIEIQLNAIIAMIKGDGIPLFLAKCICFDLINVIFTIMSEMKLSPNDRQRQYPDVLSLTEFETVEELIELVKTISADICGILREQKESANFRLRDRIVDYIGQHYSSYHFSVQAMADDLQMSASYLSRYFKDQTGQTIMHYVNSVRMEKAKRLLLEGTDSMQLLAGRIGFGSVPGFIRKFKETEGVTPGEYRSMHAETAARESDVRNR